MEYMKSVNGVVMEMTADEIIQRKADELAAEQERLPSAWASLRAIRDKKLTACDWTQLQDAAVNHEVWAAYRQQLRDLPQNTTDPFNPVWPVAPT